MTMAPAPANATAKEALVRARGLGFGYDGPLVLENVDITVSRGEVVTLVGPNGAGKSTLAKLLIGVLTPKRGQIERRGSLRIGYVPQRLSVDATLPMTVRRFLALGRPDPADLERAQDEMAVAPLRNRQLRALSGGQMQRVLLTRALSRRPDLLVLDEPAQGLDLQGQAELSRLLAVQRVAGMGVLLVSHDLSLVLSCTDRVLCIDRCICCAGTPEKIVNDPAYHRLLGPQAAQALAVYRQQHGDDTLVDFKRHAGNA